MEVTKRDVTVGLESSTASHTDQPINPNLASPLLSVSLNAPAVNEPPSISDSQTPSVGREAWEDTCTDSVEKSVQKEQAGLENKVLTTARCESSEPSVNCPRLSLFSGMELINRGKPVCLVEPVPVEPDTQNRAEAFENIDLVMEKSSERTAELSSSSCGEQVSAFSFLNL